MSAAVPRNRRTVEGVRVTIILLLLTVSACGRTNSPHLEGTSADNAQWAVVQGYLDLQAAWEEQAGGMHDIFVAGDGTVEENLQRAEEEHGQLPDATAALAAARQLVAAGGPYVIEAAEFLIERPGAHCPVPVPARHIPCVVNEKLRRLDRLLVRALGAEDRPRRSDGSNHARSLSHARWPTAQYHLASGLMREAKRSMMSSSDEDHAARRERALGQAKGLSTGVENETFDDPMRRGGDEMPRTFAQAEADLIARIEHATVGGTLPEWTGQRLDGTEEPLSAYRGRVLLIDFWATWCAPCIDALPELREMVADLPADRFALLAVSVDEELETVTAFMEREAMPWYNWHLGRSSDLERILDVRGFPTYLLADENGRVLSNGDNWLAQLRCMAERAVAGESPDCPAAEWLGAQ